MVPREGDWPRRVALEIVLGLSEMGLVPERQLSDGCIGRLAAIVLKGLPPMEIGLMILEDLIHEGQTPASPG